MNHQVKIIDYCVVSARLGMFSIGTLSEVVREAMAKGWVPLGGVAYGAGELYQAMVKYEQPADGTK